MRLYKITALEQFKGFKENPEKVVKWVGSKADGVTARKALADDGWSRKEITEVEVDVPTDKAGLIAFLNELGAK